MSNMPETPEHDPRLAAAWREHSTELPSAQLDAAILAAAHRAVGSAPQDAARQPREATSPQRWWMPLAAAATIGAIAVGILQNVPQQHSDVATSVSDMPAQPAASREQVAPPPEAKSKIAPPPEAQIKIAPPPEAQRPVAPPPASFAATPPAAPAAAPARSTEKTVASAMDSAAPSAAAINAAPQPFPADRKKESGASVNAAPQPFTADTKMESEAGPRATERARMAPTPGMEQDELRRQNASAPSVPAASGTVALGKSMARQDAGAAKAVDIDASILRIRRLHDEGKLADAAKELIALRAVATDADQRLPPELRAWAATVKQ
jgi:hypothetical protein